MAKDNEQAQIAAVHARNNAHDSTGHIADAHARNSQPPPDVFERRAVREVNRQNVERLGQHGITRGGWVYNNPYGSGPPAGGSDAADNTPPKKRK